MGLRHQAQPARIAATRPAVAEAQRWHCNSVARTRGRGVELDLEARAAQPEHIRRVGGKTFYLRDGVRIDSEFKAEDPSAAVVALKFAGAEYFKLLADAPRLAECFALGPSVVVVWKGKVYRVEDAG
jgi:hypothetical protein